MATSIAGMILRASDRFETARFYSALGLNAHEHQHGGPAHYEVGPMASDGVVEIYLRSPAFSRDTLMLNVDSIEKALTVAVQFGIKAKMAVREMTDAKFIYISDPDGRSVMLIEKK